MLTPEEGRHVTVRFDTMAALLRWNDEQRTLIGTDGFAVRLDPGEWPDGDAVVRAVDALVPPGLTVAIDAPGPERPRRDQAPAAPPPATAAPPRTRPRVGSLVLRGLCFAVVAFGILAVVGGDVSGGIAFVVIGGLGLAWQLLASQRRFRHRGG
jgi:small-conductance mechanosensitive channel